jgi:signal transduction histidine kinase
MKFDTFLFIFALILAFATGNISYVIKSDQQVGIKDLSEINDINQDLQKDYFPDLRLDLNADYSNYEKLKLLKPLPAIKANGGKIELNSSTCYKNKLQQLSSEYLDKEMIWLGYLCQQIPKLPKKFFITPPYLHRNGKSFAYMYFELSSNTTVRTFWYRQHAKYMHINELKKISWPLDERYQFLYNQPENIIKRIVDGDKVILAQGYYLIKTGDLRYFIIETNRALKYFKRAGYDLSTKSQNCFIKAGNVCWSKRAHSFVSFVSQTSIIIFIGTLIIFFMTAKALYTRIKKQKEEEEKKKHALRVLTHELRTPVASLLLQINNLSTKLKDSSEEITHDVLRLESDIYRLKHLAEKSKSYLQTDTEEDISLNKDKVELRELIEEVRLEFESRHIEFECESTVELFTDPYWLKMCLSNLVENAFRYGKAPVVIKLYTDEKSIFIEVIDQGEIVFKSIKQLLKTKHENTKGLGLGLNIVARTLKNLGAELKLKNNPTTFQIIFKKDIA